MFTSRIALFLVPAALLLALPGCDDPAKGKSAATVSSAAPPPTTKAASAPTASGDIYTVDATNSSVGFVGSKVTGSHPGKFNSFTGTIGLSLGKIEGGKVNLTINVGSVKSDDEKLDGHLKSPDFFDVAKYPTATFTSSEIKAGAEKGGTHTVSGELDFHGVKKSISFPATITASGDVVSATAEFSISRKEFGIVYPGMANDLIRDDVLIKLVIKAPKKA